MNENDKLDEVTGINVLKEQLNDFFEYRKTLETAVNEMHKTIVNLSERLEKNENIDEKFSKEINSIKSEVETLRKPIGKMAESVGKIDTIADRTESISSSLERTSGEIKNIKDALETVGKKADKSLELKKKLGDLLKFLISD